MKNKRNSELFRNIKWLFLCTYGFRIKILLITALSAAYSLLGVAFIWVFKMMVDTATGVRPGVLYEQVFLIAIILVLQQFSSICESFCFNWIQQKFSNVLKEQFFSEILNLEWMEFTKNHSGSLLTRLNSDTASVMDMLTSGLPGMVVSLIHLFSVFCVMLFLDPVIAVMSVITIPLSYFLYLIFGKKIKASQHAYVQAIADNNSFLQETIQNTIVVKTFLLAIPFREKLKTMQLISYKNARKKMLFSVTAGSILNLGFSASYISAFLLSAFRMQAGLITLGTLSAFLQLVNQLQTPLFSLSGNFSRLLTAYVATERLQEIMSLAHETDNIEQKWIRNPSIIFQDVSFSYGAEAPILHHLSVRFEAGTSTAIIGRTGAGKTTLIRLILGLISPNQGCVLLTDGKTEEPVCPATRCNISYVPQGNSLFSGSIRENILMGNIQAREEQIKKAIYASCSDFIYHLSEGLETKIGEKNTGLSEGQALRIAIARALVRNSEILIFDEATSALDEKTQLLVFTRIKECFAGKTMLFITHKLSMAAFCDQVLKVGPHNIKWLNPNTVSQGDLED